MNTNLHRKQKQVKSTLKPSLREKFNKRSMQIRKGDKVQVMRGKHKGRTGEVKKVHLKKQAVEIEDIERENQEGERINLKIHPSNIKITQINLDDPKRKKITERKKESE